MKSKALNDAFVSLRQSLTNDQIESIIFILTFANSVSAAAAGMELAKAGASSREAAPLGNHGDNPFEVGK